MLWLVLCLVLRLVVWVAAHEDAPDGAVVALLVVSVPVLLVMVVALALVCLVDVSVLLWCG